MKQFYILLTALLMGALSFSQGPIVNIPDANFKNALLNDIVADFDGDGTYDGDVDANNDGEIQESEAESVLKLNVNYKNISSLEGVQVFINLKYLACGFNQLTSLNLNQNILLEGLFCNTNYLNTLDLTYNSNLSQLDLENCQLLSLNLKNGSMVSNLYFPVNPNLEYICVDQFELSQVQNFVDNYNYTSCTVSTDCSVLSVEKIMLVDTNFNVYPNPAKDIVNIQGKHNVKEITIFDINGRILKSISVVGSQLETAIDITELSQGVYFLRAVSDKGQFVSKLVKE